MSRKKRNEAQMETEEQTTDTTDERKSRALDIDALRVVAKGLPDAEGDILTKHIDNYIEASEKRKIAGKKLRAAIELLAPKME